jgi:hypothetical protein
MQSFTIAAMELMALQLRGSEAVVHEVMSRAHALGIEAKRFVMDMDPATGHQVLTVFGDPYARELEAWED